jgi:hypothetical protein
MPLLASRAGRNCRVQNGVSHFANIANDERVGE